MQSIIAWYLLYHSIDTTRRQGFKCCAVRIEKIHMWLFFSKVFIKYKLMHEHKKSFKASKLLM